MDDALRILLESRTIAVVGLDERTERPAYRVASYLQSHGYRIIPVSSRCATRTVLGEICYASLGEAPVPIDVVDVFVRSERTGPVIDAAIAKGAKAVWLQEGITNDVGLERARAAGLATAQDRCAMVAHRTASGSW